VSDQLSSDLASLKIDRSATGGSGSRGTKLVVWLGLVGALAYAAYARGLPYLEAQVFKTEVAVTEIASISPSQASVELTSSGYVEPQIVSRVGAKVPGRVARVHVREGDTVKAGQLLLELEQADREAAMESARARSAAAEARVQTARATLSETLLQARRQRQLAQNGVAPAANADDLEARVSSLEKAAKAAEAEVKSSDAEVATQRVNLQYMRIYAPIAGRVTTKPPEVGELVGTQVATAAGTDKTIEIADFATLMVETDVPEGRLHLAKLGSPCEISLDAFPGRRYRGEAVEIGSRVDRAKATVRVKVKFVDDATGVLPDMSARVSFLTAAIDEAALKAQAKTVVPGSALVERSGAKVVFVVEGDTVHMRNVRLGEKVGDGYELLEGPSPGTRVVASPPTTLADGRKIKEKT
jgi:RND family efflux transporter MFP subunit